MQILTKFTVRLTKKRVMRELVKAGKYADVNLLIKQGIAKGRISLQDEVPGERSIVILSASGTVNSSDVLSTARKFGLIRPTMGDAFLVGEQCPDEQVRGPLVFLHDPQHFWGGHAFNLVLSTNQKGRTASFVSSGGWWREGFHFVFKERS